MNKDSSSLSWFDAALSEEEGILALALRAGRIGLWSRNILTDHADWSAQLHEICGTDPKTFDGTTAALMSIIDPEDRPAVTRAVREAIDNHTDIVVEFRVYRPNGEMRWISTHGQAVYDEHGKATHTHGVAVDVTERKRSELARSHLAAIVESSDDAIISKRLDQTVLSWNEAAQRLFGYSAMEMVGSLIDVIIPPELQQEEMESLARIRRGERIDHYETTRITRDGRRVEVSISISPVRDEQGRIIGASKIARDISALRQAQRTMHDELAARVAAEAALRDTESKLRSALAEREQLLAVAKAPRSSCHYH